PMAQHELIQAKLADMATKIEASRLLIESAAEKKNRGERCDLEAGMAKLFATETAAEVSFEAMRVLGGNGYSKDFPVERFYRDAPLVVIGGGTNELQRLIIARRLLEKYKGLGVRTSEYCRRSGLGPGGCVVVLSLVDGANHGLVAGSRGEARFRQSFRGAIDAAVHFEFALFIYGARKAVRRVLLQILPDAG